MPQTINNPGKVAGANVTNGAYRAVLYGGAWISLGTLGGSESFASGLNDSNHVVGHSLISAGSARAFLWTPGATNGVPGNLQMKELGTLGGANSEAYDLNRSGQITGYADTADNQRAFRCSGGVMTDIGSLLGNGLPNSYGYSINDAGHIAGAAYNRNYTAPQAFFYNGSTAVTIGNSGSSALGVNNSDRIVGYFTTTSSVDHAFSYAAGVMTDLGTLGGNYSYAIGINNSNVIVGGSFVDTDDSIYHAFIAVSNSMVDLNGLLDSTGARWTLVEARAINDVGQIVGVGTLSGMTRAFLLNPSPRITRIQAVSTNILVSFTSVQAGPYNLAAREQVQSGAWSNVVAGLSGTGGIVTATNRGAARLPRRFYRVTLGGP
jgi:probable HAF family extracellular repeat protein